MPSMDAINVDAAILPRHPQAYKRHHDLASSTVFDPRPHFLSSVPQAPSLTHSDHHNRLSSSLEATRHPKSPPVRTPTVSTPSPCSYGDEPCLGAPGHQATSITTLQCHCTVVSLPPHLHQNHHRHRHSFLSLLHSLW
jgi:hypothetical protein